MNTMNVLCVPVKDGAVADEREDANDIVDAYLAARPEGEKDEDGALRIGVKRPRFTKLRRDREGGRDVFVHPSTGQRIVQATKELRAVDPVARARLEGMREAMEMMRDVLMRLDEATAPVRPPSEATPTSAGADSATRVSKASDATTPASRTAGRRRKKG